ncbi:Yip1 domain-containing protein [Paraphysoderma sedebokerense]|nr:Yip1 domain-containing protein [Paraphysoderma sedebokerense]
MSNHAKFTPLPDDEPETFEPAPPTLNPHARVESGGVDLSTQSSASTSQPPAYQTYDRNSTSSPISGNIGSGRSASPTRRPFVGDTLDEPVSVTILRDLTAIWAKLKRVFFPQGSKDILKDWDLWGPLLLCLALSIILSVTAPEGQPALVFTTIFVIVWCGAGMVTVNSKLLGGKLSFFQSVCVLGYCIFPLVIAATISLFIKFIIVRTIFVLVAFFWSTYASVGFLSDVRLEKRRLLAMYPVCLFYFIIGWMILISKPVV